MKENNEVTLQWGYNSKQVTRCIYMSEEINVMEQNYQWYGEGDRGSHEKYMYMCAISYIAVQEGFIGDIWEEGREGQWCGFPEVEVMASAWTLMYSVVGFWINFWRVLGWWREAKERGVEQVREVVKTIMCRSCWFMEWHWHLLWMRWGATAGLLRRDVMWSVF